MKVALLFSGQPRYLDEGYETIYKNIISKYDVDCFVHTWWEDELSGKKVQFHPTLSYNRKYFYKEDTLETIMSLYKPKAMMYQKQKEFDSYPGNYGLANPLSTHSQWYSVMKCNELKNEYAKSSNTSYDLVIRSRFDCNLMKFDVNLNQYLNSDFLYSKIIPDNDIKILIADYFAVSSEKTMNVYCDLYNNLNRYYMEGQGNKIDGWVGERLISHHLSVMNVKIKNINPNNFDVNIIIK